MGSGKTKIYYITNDVLCQLKDNIL